MPSLRQRLVWLQNLADRGDDTVVFELNIIKEKINLLTKKIKKQKYVST
ncbi:MAG TPA: hypothetical protein PLF15_00620 [bacterium]|nr:hypothetical protein [bacterium]